MAQSNEALPFGVYETPVTQRVKERLEATKNANEFALAGIEPVRDTLRERYAEAISRILVDRIEKKLVSMSSASERIALVNDIARLVDDSSGIDTEELLYEVYSSSLADEPRLQPNSLTGAALLTNSSADRNMSAEIRREIRTADRVDLLCAFIKNSGITVIRDQLEYLRDNEIPLRVITSTYCGASDQAAIDLLVTEFGAEVKVGFESSTTRLHAKAWLFRRNSGFDTAYIGSSNLSNSALIDGVEWNVRTSRASTPEVLDKFEAVFETYWNDAHYVSYDPVIHNAKLKQALQSARSGFGNDTSLQLSGLKVEPWSHQEAMLEALSAERETHGLHRNLIVAATGTGKTVVAALDYRNLSEKWRRKPSLLFVAHRNQLLEQAQRTYREVLGDPSFGEILDGFNRPADGTHVFATIQSLSKNLSQFSPDHFDVVVIDEFHHAEARTYSELIEYVQPAELLALTATPERGDGGNVARFFKYRVAYELRLWDALRLGLVAPLHYYGINDETDLRDVVWSRSTKAYDTTSLSEFYLKLGDRRVSLILNQIRKRVFEVEDLKALGFCVSIDHALFMAHQFSAAGIQSLAVTSRNKPQERTDAIRKLRDGEIKAIFTVDLFNEGVDIPEVNTLLILRPTQSPTVFLQQLGRGLRRHPGKDVCTVLDFIGQQHVEYNMENKFAALTGKRGKALTEEIKDGFPSLPGGLSVQLDRVTTERALSNVKTATSQSIKRLRTLVEQEATVDLSRFMAATDLPIEEIYRNKDNGGWTRLLRSVELLPSSSTPSQQEDFLLRRVRSMLHVSDPVRVEAYLKIASPGGPPYQELDEKEKQFARMMYAHIWANQQQSNIPGSPEEALETMRKYPAFAGELAQVFSIQNSLSRAIPETISAPGDDILFTHAQYSVAELTSALLTEENSSLLNLPREGVKYIENAHTDLFFVTLSKDEKFYSETTLYKDVPLSRSLFQWESQSTTRLGSPTADRYIHHKERGSRILLCVREKRELSIGGAHPYTLLGEATYCSHQGERPIRFEWELKRKMPVELYELGRAAV